MTLSNFASRVAKFATDNSPAILTALGVAGTVTTAYLTGKASFKAAQLLDDRDTLAIRDGSMPLDNREKLQLVWKFYIPPMSTGLSTIAFIIAANRLGNRRAAAMAAAYAISERALDEYKTKVIEKIGEPKERRIRDEVAQDRVTNNPPPVDLWDETGSVLCCDLFTGRYFLSDMESLRRAENNINFMVNNNYYASLSDFYEQIGLPKTTMSDDFGWNADKLMELLFSTTLTPGGKPCIAFDFKVAPIRGFSRLR